MSRLKMAEEKMIKISDSLGTPASHGTVQGLVSDSTKNTKEDGV